MEKRIFTEIPFVIDLHVLNEKMKLRNNKRMLETLEELIKQAEEVAKPKAIYIEAPIEEFKEDYIIIESTQFNSKNLAENIRGIDKVFPYIITSGVEVEELTKEIDDLLDQFLFDGIKTEILLWATDFIAQEIKNKYGYEEITYEIPGSLEGWDMAEQKKLFALFGDVQGDIGVKLSDSNIMYPAKSVSGIYFNRSKL